MAFINTTKGLVDTAILDKIEGTENRTPAKKDGSRPGEYVVWIEYWLDGELVRRDAHVVMKDPGVESLAVAGKVG